MERAFRQRGDDPAVAKRDAFDGVVVRQHREDDVAAAGVPNPGG
jgi:hypothetical protein